jgi:hypothetical protein
VERLPRSRGKNIILVIVDKFLKYAHFLAITHSFIAKEIAHLLLEHGYKSPWITFLEGLYKPVMERGV